jgi:hypothetical protein
VTLAPGDELRAIPLGHPQAWLSPDPHARRFARLPELVAIVHRDRVEITGEGVGEPSTIPAEPSCVPSTTGCHDLEAITAAARALARRVPAQDTATLRVDAEVPLQTVVAVLDAVRGGEACARSEGAPAPAGCGFPRIRIDGVPPLYFHVDRTATLVLDAAAVRPVKGRTVGPEATALLAVHDAARADIEGCFAGRPERAKDLDEGSAIGVLYGRAADDASRTTARILIEGFADDELERCILMPLGVEPDRRPQPLDFLPSVRVEIAMRARFAPQPAMSHPP